MKCFRCGEWDGMRCGCADGQTILNDDNVATLKTFPDACIDLVVTSPPYDNLRTYGGHSWDFPGVAEQLTRVLKPGGVIVWVVADATINGSETGTSFRQALHFMELGMRLHDTMIYQKDQVAFPDSVRYYQKFEFMFVLSKQSPKSFNPIEDHRNVSFGRKVTGRDRTSSGGFRERSGLGKECPEFSVRGNVWLMPNQLRETSHPAPFPEALARDHILSWSNEGDIVLDPFNGSGTTTKMARSLGRLGIGIEINPDYCEIAAERLRQKVLFGAGA